MKPILGVMTLLLAATLAPAAPRDDFQKLHESLMKPESWEGVPWKSSLLEARQTAFKEKKPLFLWCMDAKPLGSV